MCALRKHHCMVSLQSAPNEAAMEKMHKVKKVGQLPRRRRWTRWMI